MNPASIDARFGLEAALGGLAAALRPLPRPSRVVGGLTGFDGRLADEAGALHAEFARALDVPTEAVALASDIELACRACFAPAAASW